MQCVAEAVWCCVAAAASCCQGKPWQFKDFPFKGADKGDMVETFSNIFGAFFHYKDEKVCVHAWTHIINSGHASFED